MTRRRRGPLVVRRSWLRVALVVALVSLLAAACSGSDDDAGSPDPTVAVPEGGTLRMGLVGVARESVFDPLTVAPTNPSAMIALDLVSDSLTMWPGGAGSDEPAVPSIAASLTPDDAHTVWTVAIDPARTFSDGSPVTAGDVVFSIQRVRETGSASLAGARLDVISAIEAVDPATVRITTTSPLVQLPELLASPLYGIVSKAAVESDPSVLVGSGPYGVPAAAGDSGSSTMTTSLPPDSGSAPLVLERVSGPAGADAKPDAVEIWSYDGVAASFAAFTSGDLDWSLAPKDATAPPAEVGAILDEPTGVVGWLGVNAADPTYGDPRLRQAIAQAVDREAIIELAVPSAEPLEAIVADKVPGHVADPCGDVCDVSHDPDAARALLAQAFPDGAIPTVTLNTYDDPAQRALLDQVQRDLEAVGIPVTQHIESPDGYEAFVVSGEQGVFSLGTVGIAPIQDSYAGSSYLSTSWDNATGIRSDSLDGEIRAARGEVDATKRQDGYLSVERQVLAQYVQIPLYQVRARQAVGTRLSDFETRLDGTIVLSKLTKTP